MSALRFKRNGILTSHQLAANAVFLLTALGIVLGLMAREDLFSGTDYRFWLTLLLIPLGLRTLLVFLLSLVVSFHEKHVQLASFWSARTLDFAEVNQLKYRRIKYFWQRHEQMTIRFELEGKKAVTLRLYRAENLPALLGQVPDLDKRLQEC